MERLAERYLGKLTLFAILTLTSCLSTKTHHITNITNSPPPASFSKSTIVQNHSATVTVGNTKDELIGTQEEQKLTETIVDKLITFAPILEKNYTQNYTKYKHDENFEIKKVNKTFLAVGGEFALKESELLIEIMPVNEENVIDSQVISLNRSNKGEGSHANFQSNIFKESVEGNQDSFNNIHEMTTTQRFEIRSDKYTENAEDNKAKVNMEKNVYNKKEEIRPVNSKNHSKDNFNIDYGTKQTEEIEVNQDFSDNEILTTTANLIRNMETGISFAAIPKLSNITRVDTSSGLLMIEAIGTINRNESFKTEELPSIIPVTQKMMQIAEEHNEISHSLTQFDKHLINKNGNYIGSSTESGYKDTSNTHSLNYSVKSTSKLPLDMNVPHEDDEAMNNSIENDADRLTIFSTVAPANAIDKISTYKPHDKMPVVILNSNPLEGDHVKIFEAKSEENITKIKNDYAILSHISKNHSNFDQTVKTVKELMNKDTTYLVNLLHESADNNSEMTKERNEVEDNVDITSTDLLKNHIEHSISELISIKSSPSVGINLLSNEVTKETDIYKTDNDEFATKYLQVHDKSQNEYDSISRKSDETSKTSTDIMKNKIILDSESHSNRSIDNIIKGDNVIIDSSFETYPLEKSIENATTETMEERTTGNKVLHSTEAVKNTNESRTDTQMGHEERRNTPPFSVKISEDNYETTTQNHSVHEIFGSKTPRNLDESTTSISIMDNSEKDKIYSLNISGDIALVHATTELKKLNEFTVIDIESTDTVSNAAQSNVNPTHETWAGENTTNTASAEGKLAKNLQTSWSTFNEIYKVFHKLSQKLGKLENKLYMLWKKMRTEFSRKLVGQTNLNAESTTETEIQEVNLENKEDKMDQNNLLNVNEDTENDEENKKSIKKNAKNQRKNDHCNDEDDKTTKKKDQNKKDKEDNAEEDDDDNMRKKSKKPRKRNQKRKQKSKSKHDNNEDDDD